MTDEPREKGATIRVREALTAAGLEAEIIRVAETARTAEGAAEAVGVEVGQIVKSLVFLSAGDPVLALVSGANRLDTAKLAMQTGGTITRADAAAVRAATGYAIGGIPPLGHATSMPVYLDEALMRYPVVWAAAGTPDSVFPVAPGRLAEAVAAVVCDLAE